MTSTQDICRPWIAPFNATPSMRTAPEKISPLASEVIVVVEPLQVLVVLRGLQPRQNGFHDRVRNRRTMAHIKVERVKLHPQMELWVIVETVTAIPLIAICDRPAHNIAESVVVKV